MYFRCHLNGISAGPHRIRKHHDYCSYRPSCPLTDCRWHNIAHQYWRPIRQVHRQHRHRHYQEPRIAVSNHVLHRVRHFYMRKSLSYRIFKLTELHHGQCSLKPRSVEAG